MKGKGKSSSANSSGMGKAQGRAFGSSGNATGGTGSAKKMGGVLSEGEAAQIRVQVPVIQPPIFDLEVVNSGGGNLGYQTGTCTMRLGGKDHEG